MSDFRIIISWGEFPTDLDNHLWTPEIEGWIYHIYWNQQGSLTSAPYAQLDHDDIDSYGPETMTIGDIYEGTYYSYVHNYSQQIPLAGCGAQAQLYSGNTLLQSLSIPTTGEGDYWNLFTIHYENNTTTITTYDDISNFPIQPPTSMAGMWEEPKEKPRK